MPPKGSGASSPADEFDEQEQIGLTAFERMDALATDYKIDTHSLVTDCRDAMLEQIKHRPKPWSTSTEDEQRQMADACEHAANELVRQVVEGIASRGKNPVRVLLTKIAMGDDIVITGKVKALGEVQTDEAVMTLHHSRNKIVMLTVADVSDFQQEHPDADIDPDEPPLDFEAGSHNMGEDDETEEEESD